MGDLLGSSRVAPQYQLPQSSTPSTSQIVTPQGRGRGGRYYLGLLFDARVLLDPGATHSFVSPVFALKSGWQASRMVIPLSVATPLSDSLDSDIFFPNCPVLIRDRELPVDLVLLDVMDFDVILGMDWLSQHYAVVDCQSKEVIFRIPDEEEFKFVGDKSYAP